MESLIFYQIKDSTLFVKNPDLWEASGDCRENFNLEKMILNERFIEIENDCKKIEVYPNSSIIGGINGGNKLYHLPGEGLYKKLIKYNKLKNNLFAQLVFSIKVALHLSH